MTADDRLISLLAKHASLDEAIDDEFHRPLPDDLRLAQLKREKLRVKDEIVHLGG